LQAALIPSKPLLPRQPAELEALWLLVQLEQRWAAVQVPSPRRSWQTDQFEGVPFMVWYAVIILIAMIWIVLDV
jgi:hypothetical protein